MYFYAPNISYIANPIFALGNYLGNCLKGNWTGNNFGVFNNFNGFGNFCMMDTFNYTTMPSFSTNIFMGMGANYNNMPVMNFNPLNNFSNIGFNNFTIGGNFGVQGTKKTNKSGLGNYNAKKGEKLSNDAMSHAVGFTEHCAKYVSDALERTGLNTNMNRAHGYYLTYEFRKNPNFKEVSVNSVDWKNLPAGCILLYEPGSQGYHKQYGHVEISNGDKTAVSDGVTHNIRKPDVIFIPV